MPKKKTVSLAILENPSSQGTISCTTCKRPLTVQIAVQGDTLADVGGIVDGCEYSRECVAALADLAKGKTLDEAWMLTDEDVRARLAKVNPKLDCDLFSVGALKLALRNFTRAFE